MELRSAEALDNIKQEIEFAQLLEEAEVRKFRSGVSAFFIVNVLEQNSPKAQIKYLNNWQ